MVLVEFWLSAMLDVLTMKLRGMEYSAIRSDQIRDEWN